jgi:hypothetical protein
MKIGTKLLKWWLIFCLTILGFGASYHFLKLSFLIIVIFVFTSIWIGRKTYINDPEHQIDVGWFIAESCLALGMVGTVTGFLYMLGTTFENIDVSNTQTLQDALASMARGMSTALYTTLTGLIASLIIKIQLVNYEVSELAD